MATSGTTAFNMDILDMVEEAYERAGMELRTGYELKSARRSMQLMALEWGNRGINLWTVTEASIAMVGGTATYSLPTDTIDLLEGTMRTGTGTSQVDYSLTRMSVSTYAQRTNKNTQSRPTEMYIDRQLAPTVTFWPVPPDATWTFNYWYLRQIEDAGDANTNNYDVPDRFLPAFISGLAYYVAMKNPVVNERVPVLKALYEEQFGLAADEDREKASLVFTPLADYIDMDLS